MRVHLLAFFLLSFSFLLLLSLHFHLLTSSSLRLRSTTLPVSTRSLALSSSPSPPLPTAAVLLPEADLLLLLPPATRSPLPPLLCLFPPNLTSPASPAGALPSTRVPLLRCPVPPRLRARKAPPALRLLLRGREQPGPLTRILQWSYLVYDSTSTPTDVILYAKGVNRRPLSRLDPSGLRCVFRDGGAVLARTAVTSAVQEVFRCPHPTPRPASSDVLVTLEPVAGGRPAVPSVARYLPPPEAPTARSLVCACTMVRDVAKFLPEWVAYHARIGVDRFILYDNASGDRLDRAVERLVRAGHDVRTYLWPWPKTQEAGFSHAAVSNRGACEWMMYLDVDEFLYAPGWTHAIEPDRAMLPALLRSAAGPGPELVGQVMVSCRDFGPSGLREHPADGVTQGYTCRLKAEERVKSLVRLDAIDNSLENSVHHFKLRPGYESRKLRSSEAVVNHYKYQAWPEFRHKFRQRVSAYVVDWTKPANAGSKDRAPGLGFAAVEPEDWPERFCDVRDTRLKDLTRRWFNRTGTDGSSRMAWGIA